MEKSLQEDRYQTIFINFNSNDSINNDKDWIKIIYNVIVINFLSCCVLQWEL